MEKKEEKLKYDLLFYAKEETLLNNYKKITRNQVTDILKTYTVSRCPSNYKIEKRENNYFIHKIENIRENYKYQLPYINEKGELCKTSSKTQTGEKILAKGTKLYEKDLCKEMWFASYDGVADYPFDIVDIQTPLKRKREDKYGEVDILGVDIDDKERIIIYLIEAKPVTTKETLLRATIETITYKYIIEANSEKFINDFVDYMKKYDGKGKKANLIKQKLSDPKNKNPEKLINPRLIRSLILVPKRLYEDCSQEHNYPQQIYKKYRAAIDYYYVEYNDDDLVHKTKEKRIPTLFKEGRYPKIKKYNGLSEDNL